MVTTTEDTMAFAPRREIPERDHYRAERDRYLIALERILAHWNKPNGEIDPAIMARIAEEAIELSGNPG